MVDAADNVAGLSQHIRTAMPHTARRMVLPCARPARTSELFIISLTSLRSSSGIIQRQRRSRPSQLGHRLETLHRFTVQLPLGLAMGRMEISVTSAVGGSISALRTT